MTLTACVKQQCPLWARKGEGCQWFKDGNCVDDSLPEDSSSFNGDGDYGHS